MHINWETQTTNYKTNIYKALCIRERAECERIHFMTKICDKRRFQMSPPLLGKTIFTVIDACGTLAMLNTTCIRTLPVKRSSGKSSIDEVFSHSCLCRFSFIFLNNMPFRAGAALTWTSLPRISIFEVTCLQELNTVRVRCAPTKWIRSIAVEPTFVFGGTR